MPVIPFIPAAISAVSAIGSAIHGSSTMQQAPNQMPQDLGPLRQYIMQILMGGKTTPGSPGAALTVDPAASLGGINGLFNATRASALGQAKESAGNLTGSGYNNLFGSALATSLAQQQKQLADTTFQAQQSNQDTWAKLFGNFGTAGVSPGSTYAQPTGIASLGQVAGPLGQLLDQFGRAKSAPGSNVSTDSNTAPSPSWPQ